MLDKMVKCFTTCRVMRYTEKQSMDRVLELIEQEGMLPPNNCDMGTCNKHEFNTCGNQWEPEDEEDVDNYCGAV